MESTITFRKRLWTGAREVIVLQLLLLSLTRPEEELVPVEVTVRTELVGLMARILVTVFQTEVRRTDERALYSPKIKPEHLARKAIVYLRQSSEKQVRQNLESQRLQYELVSAYAAWAGKRSTSLIAISVPAQPWVRLLGKDSNAFSVR